MCQTQNRVVILLTILGVLVFVGCAKESPLDIPAASTRLLVGNEWRDVAVMAPHTIYRTELGGPVEGGVVHVGMKTRWKDSELIPTTVTIYSGNEAIGNASFQVSRNWIDRRIQLPGSFPSQDPLFAVIDTGTQEIRLSDLRLADPSPDPERPNVLVVVIDTLRFDHTGFNGYRRDTTPNLDAFAQSTAVFEHVVAPGAWTRPAIASLFSSFPTEVHQFVSMATSFDANLPTLPAWFVRNGYESTGISGNDNIHPEWGIDRGFQRFSNVRSLRPDPAVYEQYLDQLEDVQDDPWFAYVQFIGPHSPYLPSGENWFRYQPDDRRISRDEIVDILDRAANDELGWWIENQLRPDMTGKQRESEPQGPHIYDLIDPDRTDELMTALYDADIYETDLIMGQLFQDLKDRGLYDNTLIVVLTDHGEEFFDHGKIHHGHSLYEELVRTILMIKPPGETYEGRRIPGLARIEDVAPTIADYLGRELDWDAYGMSLRPAIEGEPLPDRVGVGIVAQPSLSHMSFTPEPRYLRSAQTPSRKVLHDEITDAFTFFDLLADPQEQDPLPEIPPGNDDLLEALARAGRAYRPGLNVLVAGPRDRDAVVVGELLSDADGPLRVHSALSDATVEPIDGGWRVTLRFDRDSDNPSTSGYYNPIVWLPMPSNGAFQYRFTLNGEPIPEDRVTSGESTVANLRSGPSTPLDALHVQTEGISGGTIGDAPRVIMWNWTLDGSADGPEVSEEMKRELEALGYL